MVHPIWQDFPEISTALIRVREIMLSEVKIASPDIRQKIQEYILAPGKFMRSGLCLLFDQIHHDTIQEDSYYLAAAIEMLHLATLIHDDVIDQSDTRRGVQTLHTSHDNRLAIYAGDYLLISAGRLMGKSNRFDKENPAFDWAVQGILNGEILQLSNQHNLNMNLRTYLKQIRGKTALLFALATYVGYYDRQVSKRQNKQAFYIGEQIGMIFQLSDDVIDYQSSQQESGKPQFQDVRNGIYTAPLLYAMDQRPALKSWLQDKQTDFTTEDIDMIHETLEETQAMEACQQLIEAYHQKIRKRLDRLPGYSRHRAEVLHILDLLDRRKS